jgi:hypothetical protein
MRIASFKAGRKKDGRGMNVGRGFMLDGRDRNG